MEEAIAVPTSSKFFEGKSACVGKSFLAVRKVFYTFLHCKKSFYTIMTLSLSIYNAIIPDFVPPLAGQNLG